MREIIEYQSEAEWLELRKSVITSTEVAALFGISPYMTKFELHHRHAGNIQVAFEDNERMKWGRRLESSIAHGIAEDNGWTIIPKKHFIRDTAKRIGSSYDFEIIAPFKGLLEIKNVDSMVFKDGWLVDDDGEIEAPPHMEIQFCHELLLAELPVLYLGALVGGNKVVLTKRDQNHNVNEQILLKVAKFWEGVDSGTPPEPNFAKDVDVISQLYGFAQPGSVLDLSGDESFELIMGMYQQAHAMEKQAKEMKAEVKARTLVAAGDAEKIIWNGGSVSTGIVGPSRVEAHDRAGYRMAKPHFKKEKSK